MKQFRKCGLVMVLVLSIQTGLNAQPLVAPLQPQKATALKIGYMSGQNLGGYFTIGIEHSLGKYNSLGLDFGMIPFNPRGRGLGRYLGLGAFGDLKHFVAFRKKPLQGIFVGGHIGGHYVTRYFTQVQRRYQTVIWGQVGITIGGQVLLANKFTTGLSLKGGYANAIHYRFYRTDGSFAGKLDLPQPLSLFLAIHFGYQF